jgi:hypothetical protein
MFQFDSFHVRYYNGCHLNRNHWNSDNEKSIKDIKGIAIEIRIKIKVQRYLIGGVFFGLGWALVGACPGPIFILLGAGFWSVLIVLWSASWDVFIWSFKDKLPH